MKKIIIFGYSHCGTTILQNIISHISDVYNIINETEYIDEKIINTIDKKYNYIVCKYPILKEKIFDKKYDDYIKIFIIRNPKYVFSSINRRCGYNCECHSLKYFSDICKIYYNCILNPINNLYLIKYEDMFDNNFEYLKKIFNQIGFMYNEDIFNNNKYINYADKTLLYIPENKPDEKNHIEYRTWQINQNFINNNCDDKINLTDEQKKIIFNDIYIINLYPNIFIN